MRGELALSNRDTHRAVACGPGLAPAAGCDGAGTGRRCRGGGGPPPRGGGVGRGGGGGGGGEARGGGGG
ncbi:hypothetical protein, partial [Nocardia brasiliensis]|uniref:hypothetical protein n=1 Tax=Nocardia brasiliensis TaxID=37326 RepID=UPI0024571920